MKKTTLTMVMTMSVLLCSGTVTADDGDRYRGGGYDSHSGDWQLGRERIRGGYTIYHRSGHGWVRVPGAAIAVADGWVLGTKPESGGYAIYRWNGYDWDQAPGGAVRIGGSYRQPWVVNNRGQRFVWNGYDWRPEYGFRDRRPDYRRGYQDHRDDGYRGRGNDRARELFGRENRHDRGDRHGRDDRHDRDRSHDRDKHRRFEERHEDRTRGRRGSDW